MKYPKDLTIEFLRKHNLIIYEGVFGSIAYGTNTPDSDTDIRGVFVQPLDHILMYGFIEQVSDKKNDIVFYELGRFIELLKKNNPNILELLFLPKDCVIQCDNLFKHLLSNRKKFITKNIRHSFGGYAAEQIGKSKGYNKKMNWEEKEMVRKTVIDFCYIILNGKSIPFKQWNKTNESQKKFALSKINNTSNINALYLFDEEKYGIVSNEDISNDIKYFSIPKDSNLVGYLYFNKDQYSTHCMRYNEYKAWVKNRNVNRYLMNKEHGKNYDSKNMYHCIRLLNMSLEAFDTGELRVRCSNEEVQYLMSVRRGEIEYEELIKIANEKLKQLDEKFENTKIPEHIDIEYVDDILMKMRKFYYKIK